MTQWYKLQPKEVVEAFDTNATQGLSSAEVAQRLQRYGANELVERGAKSRLAILWEQLTGLMVVILIISGLISAFLGEIEDAVVILAIVIMNALLGYSQEFRAEQAIAALKKLAVPTVRVRREGQIMEISARDLVPGDMVFLEAGNLVSADGRIIESVNLQVQEAALTGESEAVEKDPGVLDDKDLPLGDRRNMVYMGTVVTYGRGVMVVTETGMKTELGNIANLLQEVEREPTPLQRRLDQLGKTLAWIALAIIGIVFVEGLVGSQEVGEIWGRSVPMAEKLADLIRSDDLKELFLTGVSLAVAAVPEGLPAVVTITLALGSQRMLKRRALIRKLPAVETLGSVNVICSDKTGTLTENRMTVTMLDVAGRSTAIQTLLQNGKPVLPHNADSDPSRSPTERGLVLLIKAMALCSDALLQPAGDGSGTQKAIGDPTEGALVVAAAELGLDKTILEQRWPRVAEVPFTSERKRMTTVHQSRIRPEQSDSPWRDAPYVAFCKGSVDGLLEICQTVWSGEQLVPLDEAMRQRITKANETIAQQGQRVLGVAFRPVTKLPTSNHQENLEQQLTFIGMVGMIDPARPEVKEAVARCLTAGIRPVMITGDHPLTARHIARELQIAQENSTVLTGADLTKQTVESLETIVDRVPVYARVSPEHKLDIVTALQANGHIVAMTGDGVNDAPALKKADIGVAMGITGTDVSKEAADMVLLDDNFATIVAAVEEGRVIYDNIRKFIKYILSSNTGELMVMFMAPFLSMPLPLIALQILWINLVTDGLPGLALAVEPAETGVMRRPPFKPNESVFSRGVGWQIILIGILVGGVSLLVGYREWLVGNPNWQTMIFTALALAQMGNVLGLRSNRDSLFKIGLLSNKPMVGAVVLTILLQLMVIYVPFFHPLFETRPLTANELAICFGAGIFIYGAVEIEKFVRQRWVR